MSGIRALLVLGGSVLASLALSLGLLAAAENAPPEPDADIGVEWDYRPAGLDDLVAAAPAIVLVEVEAVRDGEPFVGEPTDGEGEPVSFPTQRVDVRLIRTLEGEAPASFPLFKLGSGDEVPAGDPAYVPGERYLVFVRPRLGADGEPHPDRSWLPVAPDGRLERLSSGELQPLIEGPVADELGGETVREAGQEIAQAQEPRQ